MKKRRKESSEGERYGSSRRTFTTLVIYYSPFGHFVTSYYLWKCRFLGPFKELETIWTLSFLPLCFLWVFFLSFVFLFEMAYCFFEGSFPQPRPRGKTPFFATHHIAWTSKLFFFNSKSHLILKFSTTPTQAATSPKKFEHATSSKSKFSSTQTANSCDVDRIFHGTINPHQRGCFLVRVNPHSHTLQLHFEEDSKPRLFVLVNTPFAVNFLRPQLHLH